MTDAELDRDWQPSGRRPQSTIARSFSAELMDIFRIENSLTDLDQQVDQRRQKLGQNTQELANIEARLREMEDKLRHNQQYRPGIRTNVSQFPPQKRADAAPLQPPKDDNKSRSRPGTARPSQQAPGSGQMPPTPGASEDGNGEE